jgi:hypothetical protein
METLSGCSHPTAKFEPSGRLFLGRDKAPDFAGAPVHPTDGFWPGALTMGQVASGHLSGIVLVAAIPKPGSPKSSQSCMALRYPLSFI